MNEASRWTFASGAKRQREAAAMTEYEKRMREKKEKESYESRRANWGEAAGEWDRLHAWYLEYRQKKPKKVE